VAFWIRPARSEDLDAVMRLYVQLAPGPPYPEAVITGREVEVWAEMLSADRLVVFVAESDDAGIVGTACLLWMPSLTDGATPTGFVENLVVDELQRRRGVGRALVDALLGRAADLGCRRVQLLSHKDRRDDAHRFYASMGFSPEAEGFRIVVT
jgi:GNAT superfamily N-acetyltransferase